MLHDLVLAAVSYTLGYWWKRIIRWCKHVYYCRKYHICLWYQPTGYRETRNGTNSDFCRRCGKPAGNHRWS